MTSRKSWSVEFEKGKESGLAQDLNLGTCAVNDQDFNHHFHIIALVLFINFFFTYDGSPDKLN